MEYVQERVATLHDFGDAPAAGPSGASAAVVVPMTGRERGLPAAERVLAELERIDPAAVFVPVRSSPGRIAGLREWLDSFDLRTYPLWCNAPAVEDLLADAGLGDGSGKGRDVWLALGPAAATADRIVVHDADARGYEAERVRRLLAPLAMGFRFAKGYYARIEDGRLYGRLCRLFYEPLVRALAADGDAPVLEYLRSFRYALAGEFALAAPLARRLRPPPAWGLEVATLGDAFARAGFERSAQVDLGTHEHDHRSVGGDGGLEGMSRRVGAELLRVCETHGVDPDYDRLPDRYRETGRRLVERYGADARFNGLEYDREGELEQVERYATAIEPPGPDRRLPPWTDAPFSPDEVLEAATPWREGRPGRPAGRDPAQD